jgi:benzoate-CoA ligase family protein
VKIFIAGAGPSGLYVAYLLKKAYPSAEITLQEQNAADSTFGFGVVFSDVALNFLRDDDPETYALITPHMETWRDLTLHFKGETIAIDGMGFAAIERLKLLQLLQSRLTAVGVTPQFSTHFTPPNLDDYDLIIASDGANSSVRAAHFTPHITQSTNKFVWYGVNFAFDSLSQTFIETDKGVFNAHHYRYAPNKSTFIVECDAATFAAYGFEHMSEDESRLACEAIFAETLQGHSLITNKSLWRNFPHITNDVWQHKNVVLMGDALRTAHFSIGSGTRLALEDAIALVKSLQDNTSYEAARRPIVEKIVGAAHKSAAWYDDFRSHMQLAPWDFAWSYIQRSGRVDIEKLRRSAPLFVAGYEASKGIIIDPVADDAAFPADYNASSILFDNLAKGHGEKPALIGDFGTVTYAEICAEASQIAHALTDFGLQKSDRVICLLDDTPAYPAVIFGAMHAGFVPVLLNTLSPADLIAYYVQDSGAKIAIVEADLYAKIGEQAFKNIKVVIANSPSYVEFIKSHASYFEAVKTHKNDMSLWMYSSGSTGKPKGVVHLHHDLAYTISTYSAHILKLKSDDICFSVPKIFFAYGLGNSCTFPFAAGATALLMRGQPKPKAIYEAIRQHKPTVFFGLPTLYTGLIKDEAAETADLSSVRLCLSAAEVLAAEVFNAWRARFNLEIVEGLGSTELLHIYLSNAVDNKRIGAAGLAVPGYDFKLMSDDGLVEQQESGVLMIRGHSSAPLYWNRADKTAETMRGDWVWTGDRFDKDADGFYYFKGRADDLIKVSGQWVYPLEVELCLADHPDVQECAVMAKELDDRRMTLEAFVSLKAGIAVSDATTLALQNFVKTKLVPYKYPRIVTYLDDLPKTGTGKIDRQALKKLTS